MQTILMLLLLHMEFVKLDIVNKSGTKKTVNYRGNIKDFDKSVFGKNGYRIDKKPSKEVVDAVKDNEKAPIVGAGTIGAESTKEAASLAGDEQPEPDNKKDANAIKEKDIEAVRAEYEKVTGKNVPPRYRNNKEWLLNKMKLTVKEKSNG